MIDLIPCPFCASEAILRPSNIQCEGIHFVIVCSNEDCEAQPDVHGNTEKEAITRWNTRKYKNI
jgi:Lar family restriction alleviation protein